jgi:integrase
LIYEVGKPQILALRDELITKKRSGNTINHYFNAISKIYQMLINEWAIKIDNPIGKGIRKMRAPSGRVKRIQGKAEEALLKVALPSPTQYLDRLCNLPLQTGMRRGEIMGLNWGDVDLT